MDPSMCAQFAGRHGFNTQCSTRISYTSAVRYKLRCFSIVTGKTSIDDKLWVCRTCQDTVGQVHVPKL